MTCSTLLFGIAAAAAALSAEVPVPEVEAERQPGLIRITGIDESDRVLLDGELMGDGKRLMRFGSKLFVNPGQYTLTVLTRNNQTSCVPISMSAKTRPQQPAARGLQATRTKTCTKKVVSPLLCRG